MAPLKQRNSRSRITLEILKLCSSNLAHQQCTSQKKHNDTCRYPSYKSNSIKGSKIKLYLATGSAFVIMLVNSSVNIIYLICSSATTPEQLKNAAITDRFIYFCLRKSRPRKSRSSPDLSVFEKFRLKIFLSHETSKQCFQISPV